MKRWTLEEIKLLEKVYPTKSISEILCLFPNRTKAAIIKKAMLKKLRNNIKININLTDIEIGYIAGLIDGEGTITFNSTQRKYIGCPKIIIVNTDEKMIDWICKKIPRARKSFRGKTTKHKKAFAACITQIETIKEVLKKVHPVLITKKEQSSVMLNYLDKHIKYGCRKRDKNGSYLNGIENKYYLNALDEIRKLNERGIKDSN